MLLVTDQTLQWSLTNSATINWARFWNISALNLFWYDQSWQCEQCWVVVCAGLVSGWETTELNWEDQFELMISCQQQQSDLTQSVMMVAANIPRHTTTLQTSSVSLSNSCEPTEWEVLLGQALETLQRICLCVQSSPHLIWQYSVRTEPGCTTLISQVSDLHKFLLTTHTQQQQLLPVTKTISFTSLSPVQDKMIISTFCQVIHFSLRILNTNVSQFLTDELINISQFSSSRSVMISFQFQTKHETVMTIISWLTMIQAASESHKVDCYNRVCLSINVTDWSPWSEQSLAISERLWLFRQLTFTISLFVSHMDVARYSRRLYNIVSHGHSRRWVFMTLHRNYYSWVLGKYFSSLQEKMFDCDEVCDQAGRLRSTAAGELRSVRPAVTSHQHQT